jgi:hypothetical protein
MRQMDFRDVSKKASENVSASIVVSPESQSLNPSPSTVMTHQKTTMMTLNQLMKEIFKWNTLLIDFAV